MVIGIAGALYHRAKEKQSAPEFSMYNIQFSNNDRKYQCAKKEILIWIWDLNIFEN
jgi:hypothetical protein